MRLGLALLAASPFAAHANVSGTYIDEENASVTLVLMEAPDGTVSGNFAAASSIPVTARRSGDSLAGRVGGAGLGVELRGTIDQETLTILLTVGTETERHVFRRTGPPPGVDAAPTPPTGVAGNEQNAAVSAGAQRKVTINGVRLSDQELARIEQTFRVRIVDADYWYDALSGAWGIKGGPTRGFIYAGLNLGGPLAANASGGGTGVFINGRELHPVDVDGLRKCTQVNPGRYWVGPDGIGGYEGGPPIFNLVALCSPPGSGGRAGGWLCDGGSCGTTRTVTGPYAVTSEGGGQAGVSTDQGLILTPN
jgi:hypothetical protein